MMDLDPWARLRRAGIVAMLTPPQHSPTINLHVIRQVPSSIAPGLNGERELRPGGMMCLAPAAWEPVDETGGFSAPFVRGSLVGALGAGMDDATAMIQAFMDLGAALGMVPTAGPDLSGELAAVRGHLEDMRLLAGVRPDIPEHPVARAVRGARRP